MEFRQLASTPPSPWLSVLLPVYGVEPYLTACAQSLLSQAGPGVELVFLDDASPDGSAALLERLQAAHPQQVRVLRHTHNRGISTTRNALLDAARGEYLWFVDPDDLVQPGALAALERIVREQGPDLVMCDFCSFDDATGRPRHTRYAHIPSFAGPAGSVSHDRDALLRGLFLTGRMHPWSKIVRRSLWTTDLRFPDGRVFEDLAVMPRVALRVGSYVHAPEVWIGYRQRAGSTLASLTPQRIDDWMAALEGYAGELVHSPVQLTELTRFTLAHFCARSFVRAARRGARLGVTSAALAHHARQWQSASPLSADALLSDYARRGWLWRWLQLRHWLRRAGV
jgi:hypothetical protein